MKSSSYIRQTCKVITVVFLLVGVCFSTFAAGTLPAAYAQTSYQETSRYYVKFVATDSYKLTSEAQNAIVLAMNAWPDVAPQNDTFYLIDLNWHTWWATATLSSANLEAPLPNGEDTHLNQGNLITLIAVNAGNQWQAAIDIDQQNVQKLLTFVPDSELSLTTKNILFPLSSEVRPQAAVTALQAYNNYKFPWPRGNAWYMTQGWHDPEVFGYPAKYGLDFDVSGGDDTNSDILAAAPGTVTYRCNLGTQAMMVITTEGTSERFGYLHLDSKTLRFRQGDRVNQGDVLGRMLNTDHAFFSDGCGRSNRMHLHIYVPVKPFTMDGRTFSDTSLPSPSTQLFSSQDHVQPSCNPNSDQIALYEAADYKGTSCKVLGIGEYANPGAMGFPDNLASSIKVGSNVKAILYEHDNYGGTSEEFSGEDPDLGNNPIGHDRVSSVKVQRRTCNPPNADQIVIYEAANYTGTSCKVLGVGEYANPSAMGFPDNLASSIKVGSNVRAILYEHDNYGGTSEEFSGDDPDFGNNSIGHDRLSSVKVQRRTCDPNSDQIALYEHPNYDGTCKVLRIGEYANPGAMGFPNDAASSIKVGGNVKAILCEHDNYGGTCEEFNGEDPDLGNNSINDRASSVKVQQRTCDPPNADQIVIYEAANYIGTSCKVLGIGEYANPGAMGFPDNLASSIKVGSNVRAILYEHDSYGGTSEEFSGDDPDFGSNPIGHDRVSSVKVQRRTCDPPNADQIAFFVDASYSGDCVVKGIGEYPDAGSMGISDNTLTSIKVGSNVRVTLCKDNNYAGGCEDLMGDDPNLGDNSIGTDTVSSAKVISKPIECSPNANQVAFFVDANYRGACVVKGIGEYPDPSSMVISDNNLSSVKVGGNVKLTLYADSNYSNTAETFMNDDPDLSDNTIGNDRASSAKVEARGTLNKVTPVNGAGNLPLNVTLTWSNGSSGANSYQYCYDSSDDGQCDTPWHDAGTAASAEVTGLSPGITYYWQVCALNSGVSTCADNNTWWHFGTASTPGPRMSTTVNVPSIAPGGTALVSVSLLDAPPNTYASAEFICTFNATVVEARDIAFSNLFGADAVPIVTTPQNGSFIAAIAGSNGSRATTGGEVLTFNLKGQQVGQTTIECTGRVSKGDNFAIPLPSSGSLLKVQSRPDPVGFLRGQVIASKPVTVKVRTPDNTIIPVPIQPDGTFILPVFPGNYTVDASASGFLSAETPQGSVTIKDGDTITLPTIKLLAGDIDGNGVIDQLDALTIGMNYGTAIPAEADLNNDSVIDFLDLELLAMNYKKTAPVAWQENNTNAETLIDPNVE